ncbi:hypothetical protein F8M41_004772 [Gigaspora margarita]|uniref:Uncharacterized protein n=1 Tax=Gigaspora margarita TaxID=4874 RepID=A0A8H4AXD7_GIGMA|nr:hypothetical protein F8M41_004772 [Gigaspora margarita]
MIDNSYFINPQIESIISAWLLAISIALTLDSFIRVSLKNKIPTIQLCNIFNTNWRRNVGYWLLKPVNLATLISEIIMPIMIFASSFCSKPKKNDYCNAVSYENCSEDLSNPSPLLPLYLVIYPITQFGYVISKTLLLHLAYIRCDGIAMKYNVREIIFFKMLRSRKFYIIHKFILFFRFIELSFSFAVSIITSACQSTSTCDGTCYYIAKYYYISRDILYSLFRLYYIALEVMYYYAKFNDDDRVEDQNENQEEVQKEDQEERKQQKFQSVIFMIDITQLILMSLYRIFAVIIAIIELPLTKKIVVLPTYVYAELSSTAFTIFVMTRFVDTFLSDGNHHL